ncbi:MAG TPA: ComEA family DNA-binding protein [Actinomycetota bacterium]|nr:ComEA family DNA-binding protein [Actinomycetota bacterium]
MSIKERLDTLSRGELAGLIAVLVVTLAGAGLWYTRSLPKPVQIASSAGPVVAGQAAGAATASASANATPIIVDVTGWVHDPGVYEFVTGDRVIDAVERAGGAKPGADLSILNLAAPLTDGTQVVVSKEGAAGAVGATGSSTGGITAGALININTATATEFETLSGIGEVLAAAIVDYRTENGPFTSVDELEDVSGIGPSTLDEIRDQVTV